MKKWENVGRGLSICFVLTFLSPYPDKMGISLWIKYVCIIVVLFGVFFILSKIKFLQKEVTNKVGFLTLIAGIAASTVIYYSLP